MNLIRSVNSAIMQLCADVPFHYVFILKPHFQEMLHVSPGSTSEHLGVVGAIDIE